eukprot:3221233-Pleurochrysis_carterae.AAC.3
MIYDISNLTMSNFAMHMISSFADEHGKHVSHYKEYLMGTAVLLENDLASFASILYNIICKVYSPVQPVRVCKALRDVHSFERELLVSLTEHVEGKCAHDATDQ